MCKITITNKQSQHDICKFALTVHRVNALCSLRDVAGSGGTRAAGFSFGAAAGKHSSLCSSLTASDVASHSRDFSSILTKSRQTDPSTKSHTHTRTHAPYLLLSQHGAKWRRCSICMQTSRLIQMIRWCAEACARGFKEHLAYFPLQWALHWVEY